MTAPITEQKIMKITNLEGVGRKIVKYQNLGYKLDTIVHLDDEVNLVALHFFRYKIIGFSR